jgi:hypothetical protein
MSVYYLVGGLRRWLAGAAPWAQSIVCRQQLWDTV